METKIYKGRGNGIDREDYLDFINYVFGFNGNDTDFLKLLPKLYKPEYQPCASAMWRFIRMPGRAGICGS